MSDVTAPAATETPASTEGGQVETPAATEVQPEAFDWSPYADHTVTLKANGEDVTVPVKEAFAGYQRQADYTKAKQEIAAQREDLEFASSLAAALDRNPQATIEFLSQQFGLGQDPEHAEMLSPEEEKLQSLESTVSDLSAFQQQQLVDREFQALKAEFDDVDERAVLEHAVKIGAPNLKAAYADLKFPELNEQLTELRKKQQAASDEEAVDGKRTAAAVIDGGHGTQAGAVTPASTQGKKRTLRESLEMAMQSTGFTGN